MANKKDVPNAMDTDELSDNMKLNDITDHSYINKTTYVPIFLLQIIITVLHI